ncbi:MAG: response regulator [Deltaproteobacteria bacterium]|nr:response regulator [Deltaproteobacteria bacterium]
MAHVLVVEDDEVNQQVVVAVLESLDCRVDVVANGQEALDQLERSSSYDLVFMDCAMPTMDGFEATRAIRAREAEAAQAEGGAPVRRLPIVALTAHALPSDRKDCLAAGMDDYLTKPLTKVDLAGAIDRAKQQDWAGGQAPAESVRPDPPASSHPPGASVDLTPLRRLAATFKGDGSKVIARVVDTFLASSQKLLSAIRASVEADDPKALVSAAHTLKSSSAQVGAQRLSNLCKELEALGRGGSCEGAREIVNRISKEFEPVHEGLAAENFRSRAPTPAMDRKRASSHPLPQATVEAETTAEVEGEVLTHVLVVEDNGVNQQVVIAVLESLDCRIDVVANGQEALDRLERSSSYDLVFMDCQMPTMDGFEATRAIRAREAEAAQAEAGAPGRRLPIVALTAHALSSDRKDCLAAGMDDYLTKPFTKADLAGAIDRAKQQDGAGGQAPAESERPDPSPWSHPPGASVDPAPLRRLAATFKGDESRVIARVVNTFLATSQKLLSAIRASVEADDPKALASAAHTLKSSSAQVGAQGLSNLCKELEALGRGGSCEGARALVNRISKEFKPVEEGLAAEIFGVRNG